MKNSSSDDFSLLFKIKSMFWMTRPLNGITASIALMVSIFVATPDSYDFVPLVCISIGGFLAAAQAMVHNDIVDIEVDRINAPQRVLPRGILTIPQAKIFAIVLFVVGFFFALYVDLTSDIWYTTLVFVFMSVVLDIYNLWLKKMGFVGNLSIGLAVLMLFVYGDLYVDNQFDVTPMVMGTIGFLLNAAREVVKGIVDVEGDAQENIKTIAVRLGRKGAALFAAPIFILAIFATMPIILDGYELFTKISIIFFDVLMFLYMTLIIANPTPKRAYIIKKFILWSLFFILIVFLIDSMLYYL
ncbi:MAG: geranylgeranylglycerol-phosphate geranylgeranyltransferase [Candidatus Heimdallarchaeota archaeon]|nr:geranylgeranylglycerol-phosphate geranylgeranyltransferase [Candidatus Heimdallarchaeota archaeon]MCK5048189.1 geranylgeranylglycerol-phosphate geranylgeranyltransferase [Candidatus Heimdallarchaeota archaeon]